MRTFLIFLIIMNLLYAGWEYINPAMQVNKIPPLADNLRTLELLHEPVFQSENEVLADETDILSGKNQLEKPGEEGFMPDEQIAEAGDKTEFSTKIVDACYTLGPFKDDDILMQVRDSLAEQVTEISTRKQTQTEKHRYWVYIPASGGRNGAKQKARELKEKKVKDFYIVLRGDTKNSISLGHFREPSHASRRVKRINALGFNAEINVIYRDYDVHWLDYRLSGNTQQEGFSVEEYVSEGVSQISRSCEGDAL